MTNPYRNLLMILAAMLVLSGLTSRKAAADSYAEILKKVAQKEGVRWDLLGAEEKSKLKEFMNSIGNPSAATLPTASAQLAFWINAHNACVLKLLSDHLPVDSTDVMKISGFRDKLNCTIAGAERTIVDIQSGVIRPLFKEPRVHFALWWGVKGGPRLLAVPYTAADLEKQLEAQTQEAFKMSSFVGPASGPARITLSPLFDWFKGDFGSKDDSMLQFVRKNLPKDQAKIAPRKLSEVRYGTFDWTLDSASKS